MKATIYYLKHQGFSATKKQVEKFEKQFSPEQILRMAKDRGFKE